MYLYLDFHKQEIDDYDHWVRKCAWRVIKKEWDEYWQNNPRLRNKQESHIKHLQRYHKRRGRSILAKWYLANRLAARKKISQKEAYKKYDELMTVKSQILERRKRLGKASRINEEYFHN